MTEENYAHFVHLGGTPREVAMKVVQTQREDNAFYVCDLRELKNRVRLWRQQLPRVVPFFAVANSGIDSSRIIYANPAKQSSHLEFAKDIGVTLMTFDCAEELEKISDKNCRLILRVRAQGAVIEEKMAAKYGCSSEQAEPLLLAASNLGHSVVGVAFHVGAIHYCPESFTHAIAQARAIFDVAKRLGIEMSVLDIGGGFPGGIRKLESFEEVCEAVRCALDLHFPESSGVTIIAEPGQYFVTAPYILVAKVVAKRTRQTSIRGALCYHHDVYLNASKENCIPRDMYSFLDITFQPLGPPHDRPRTHLTTLWGATCHPLDVMEESVLFFEVSVDEWLVADNVGAYGMVKASGFNGTGFPPVHYVTSAEDAPRIAELLEASPFTPGYSQLMQAAKTVG
ncbi:hypothetical protein MRX96_035449 [Rhipicephalus microplus]